jgi:hypothetical protein
LWGCRIKDLLARLRLSLVSVALKLNFHQPFANVDCSATAWDTVEELSAAASHAKDTAKATNASDPLEQYCGENPDADECRVYGKSACMDGDMPLLVTGRSDPCNLIHPLCALQRVQPVVGSCLHAMDFISPEILLLMFRRGLSMLEILITTAPLGIEI